MQVSNQDRRLTYNVAHELCKKYGIDASAANPAYGYLRLETPILDGQTQYQFPLLQNQTYNGYNQSPTEQRLALQDNFVVGSKGFFLYFLNTVTQRPVSKLLTYIGPWNVPAGYAFGIRQSLTQGTVPLLVNGLNNEFWISGWMKYSMDYKVIIPRYDCLQHHYIPQTQGNFNTSINGVNTDPTLDPFYPYTWVLDQGDGLSDGFMPMEPNIVLSGAKNTEILYNLPFKVSFADLDWEAAGITSGEIQPRLVCIYRGVLLQNTTNVK